MNLHITYKTLSSFILVRYRGIVEMLDISEYRLSTEFGQTNNFTDQNPFKGNQRKRNDLVDNIPQNIGECEAGWYPQISIYQIW